MNNKTGIITKIAIITSLYVALVLLFPSVGFGPIQFRPAELLNFLIIVNPLYALGVTAGVFIANLFSIYGSGFDLLFGTAHTALSFLICYCLLLKIKNERAQYAVIIFVFSLTMAIIAFEICLLQNDFTVFGEIYLSLFLSEFSVLTFGSIVMWQVNKVLKR